MANLAVANLSFHELRRGLILVMEDDVVEYFGDFEALLTRHAHFGSETWFRTHRVAILPKKTEPRRTVSQPFRSEATLAIGMSIVQTPETTAIWTKPLAIWILAMKEKKLAKLSVHCGYRFC